MTQEEFDRLSVGDVVRGKSSREPYVVTAIYGSRATAVKTVDMTNPDEWDIASKVTQRATVTRIPE